MPVSSSVQLYAPLRGVPVNVSWWGFLGLVIPSLGLQSLFDSRFHLYQHIKPIQRGWQVYF